MAPPVVRTSSDFDPGAKNHIPANTDYIRLVTLFFVHFFVSKTFEYLSVFLNPSLS